MHRSKALILFAFALSAFAGGLHADTEVRVLATHPAGNPVTLANSQTFYVHIGYTTDEPVKIWARPYFEGREVAAGSNPSRSHTGSGETLGWFFFMESGKQVDEIRITAGDGTDAGTRLVATHPVRITGSDRPAAATSEPAWLATLRQQEERLQREDFEKRASTRRVRAKRCSSAASCWRWRHWASAASPRRSGRCGAGPAAGAWRRPCVVATWLASAALVQGYNLPAGGRGAPPGTVACARRRLPLDRAVQSRLQGAHGYDTHELSTLGAERRPARGLSRPAIAGVICNA